MYVDADQKDWDEFLPYCLFAYRTSKHPSINESPFFMLYGRDAKLPIEIHFGMADSNEPSLNPMLHKLQMREYLQEAYVLARKTMQIAAQKSKWSYDIKHSDKSFSVGDRVWLHDPSTPEGLKSKLTHHWHGPFRVTDKISNLLYQLADVNGKPRKGLVNVRKIKTFVQFVDPNYDGDHAHLDFDEEAEIAREQEKKLASTEQQYEIEQIVNHKVERDTHYYQVRWAGYNSEYDTWIAEWDLKAPSLLRDYKKMVKNQKKAAALAKKIAAAAK